MKNLLKLLFVVAFLSGAVQMAFSRGDKVIPQVVDGPGWATKFDLTNVSSAVPIDKTMRLSFYKKDGTKWSLQTNQGTGSDFDVSLGPRQTLRVETSGASSTLTEGYVVISDNASDNSEYSEDYVLGISVFYTFSTGSTVADTVTVSAPRPTAAATVPVQMDDTKGIYSGMVFLNWAGAANAITVDLYPSDTAGVSPQFTKTLNLDANKQWSGFLDNTDLFPALKGQTFKGLAEITATGPVVLLGLLQTRGINDAPQYSTLVPVDKEALRSNSYMVLLQASDDAHPYMPLDVDGLVVDYFRNADGTEGYSWDLEYRYNAPDTTDRYLEPFNGAGLASLGTYNDVNFDAISLPTLKSLNYNTSSGQVIDLSGSNLTVGFTFAIRTDIGNYAKARIARIIDTTDTSTGTPRQNEDIVLEVYVYR